MNTDEIIHQLESLREDSADHARSEEPDSVWHRDVTALTEAINRLKKPNGLNSTQTALLVFCATALLGLIAAFAGIIVALFGGCKAATVLLAASCGWWLEAIIAGRDCK